MKWIEIDKYNLPEGEVLIINLKERTYGYKEYILGYLSIDDDKVHAESECEILNKALNFISSSFIQLLICTLAGG